MVLILVFAYESDAVSTIAASDRVFARCFWFKYERSCKIHAQRGHNRSDRGVVVVQRGVVWSDRAVVLVQRGVVRSDRAVVIVQWTYRSCYNPVEHVFCSIAPFFTVSYLYNGRIFANFAGMYRYNGMIFTNAIAMIIAEVCFAVNFTPVK